MKLWKEVNKINGGFVDLHGRWQQQQKKKPLSRTRQQQRGQQSCRQEFKETIYGRG